MISSRTLKGEEEEKKETEYDPEFMCGEDNTDNIISIRDSNIFDQDRDHKTTFAKRFS